MVGATTASVPSAGKSTVLVATSHVVRGGIGGRAAVFALERLGHRVWSVPTVMLAYHPGHGPSEKIAPPRDAFQRLIDDLLKSPWIDEIGAVLTGYFAAHWQVEILAGLIDTLKMRNRDLIYVCDPVIGDDDRLYVSEELARAVRDMLLPRADIATPNRFELEWLADRICASNEMLAAAARQLAPPRIVVTSALPMLRGHAAALLVEESRTLLGEHPAVTDPPHGPGDLSAALITASALRRLDSEAMLRRTLGTVGQVIGQSVRAGGDELDLAAGQQAILSPTLAVQIRRLGAPYAAEGS